MDIQLMVTAGKAWSDMGSAVSEQVEFLVENAEDILDGCADDDVLNGVLNELNPAAFERIGHWLDLCDGYGADLDHDSDAIRAAMEQVDQMHSEYVQEYSG